MLARGRLIAVLPALLVGVLLAVVPAHSAGAQAGPGWQPGRVLVRPAPALHLTLGAPQDPACLPGLGGVLAGLRFTAATPLAAHSDTLILDGPAGLDVPAAVAALRASGLVAFAEPDYVQQARIVPNDERYADQQWWLTAEQAHAAWDITTGDPNMIIGILDTGVAVDHPEFAGRVLAGHNFVENNDDPYDDNGHGTHVAGIAAAQGNNGQGIAGICWQCKILPLKALNEQGQGATSAFAEGIYWGVDHGARVINISAGADFSTDTEHDAIRYAHSKGVVIVAAAGNTPDGQPQYPAGYDEVIAVSASSMRDSVAGFSSYGDYVDLAAPGINILSTWVTNRHAGYQSESGTSMASPMVAGAAALVLSVNPALAPDQVQLILEQTADDIGDPGFDPKAGWGRINILHALQQAPPGPRPAAPPSPTPTVPPTNQSRIQGTVAGPAPTDVDMLLEPQNGLPARDIQPDAAGLYVFNNLSAGQYVVRLALKSSGFNFPTPQTVTLTGSADDVATINFTLTARRPAAFDPVAAQPNTPDLTYFPPVQHTLRGVFLRYWTAHGGLPIFGYPLSEEFAETSPTDGRSYTVQYFERNRFEYHPEFAGTPNEVLLGLLGAELTRGRGFPPGIPIADSATSVWFPQVQHTLGGVFYQYWQAHGGLAIFGYPISEEFPEVSTTDGQVHTVQYFQRNRFELHPEYAGTPNEVLLGLLGVDSLRARGWIP